MISVVNSDTGEPEVYVFTADEARDCMVVSEKICDRSFIGDVIYDTEKFREQWDKLEP